LPKATPPPPLKTLIPPQTRAVLLTRAAPLTRATPPTRVSLSVDPYALNKVNVGKPSFTKDGEKIMAHKFKYFKKGDKKGEIYSGQLFVVTRL
jgi:hypothetical protein